jgi:hypothetical protein
MSSRDHTARLDLALAEQALARRQQGHLTFTSVRGALSWYERTRARLQAPPGRAPRTTIHRGCSVLVPDVDGGRGSTLEDSLAVVATIGAACQEVRSQEPGRWRAVELVVLAGWTQKDAAKRLNCNQATVSRWIGWCEGRLLLSLRRAGVVV